MLHGVLEVNADAHEDNQEERQKTVHWWGDKPEEQHGVPKYIQDVLVDYAAPDDAVEEHGGEPKPLDSRHRLRWGGDAAPAPT